MMRANPDRRGRQIGARAVRVLTCVKPSADAIVSIDVDGHARRENLFAAEATLN